MNWRQAGLQTVMVAWGLAGVSPPLPPSPRPVAPGLSDTEVVILGTALCLLVIYAIVVAHLRKPD